MQAILLQPILIHESDSELSGFWGTLANIGLQIGGVAAAPFTGGLSIPASQAASAALGGSSGGGLAKGLAAITAFCDGVIGEMNKVANNTQLNKADKLTNLNALASLLSDGTKVYQAKNGKDAEKLNQTKQAAAGIITAVNNQVETVTPTNTATGTGTTVNGTAINGATASPFAIISGIDSRYLFLGGALIGAYLLLKK